MATDTTGLISILLFVIVLSTVLSMSKPQSPSPDPPEQNTIHVNIAGMFVGVVLFFSLVWSLWNTEMNFAYLCSTLLFLLASGTHFINMRYKE